MSRKHFEALAKEIKSSLAAATDTAARMAVVELAGRIARVCSDHNPNFDDRRFLVACGISNPTRVS
jgi:hypothetical protein